MNPLRVGILIFNDVEVLDFAGPFEVFSGARMKPGTESRRNDSSAPFEVFTVARTRDPIRTVGGLTVVPRYGFEDGSGINVLVIPGGVGTRALLDDDDTLEWIAERADLAKHVTSVCTGSLLLAKCGVLGDAKATTHWSALDLLASLHGAERVVRDARVVDDGVITSAGVSAGIDMAFYLVEKLCGRAVAEDTARYIDYRLDRSGVVVGAAAR